MCLFLFVVIQIQQAIYESPDFPFVVSYIEEENKQAYQKQEAYNRMREEQKEKLKLEIEKNFDESKARYDSMDKNFYSRWAGVAFKRGGPSPLCHSLFGCLPSHFFGVALIPS